MMRVPGALVIVMLVSADVRAQQTEVVAEATVQPQPGALPFAAAVVPGVLVHGAGAYMAGDSTTASRLLAAEGVGAGALLLSVGGLALTGASRRFTGVLMPMAVTGGYLFVGSWLLDLYAAAVPLEVRGKARAHAPRLELGLGASYRYDPRASTDAVVLPDARVVLGDWTLRGSAQLAPSTSTSRVRADVRYRVFDNRRDFVDLQVAFTNNRLGEADVNALSVEFAVPARLDLAHVGPLLRGAFAELAIGGMLTEVHYRAVDATEADSAVLARCALGIYLGDGDGEVALFYDHRRDTLAGGIILQGLSPGILGHAGVDARYYFSEHVGATAMVEIGSALFAGMGVTMRFGEGN